MCFFRRATCCFRTAAAQKMQKSYDSPQVITWGIHNHNNVEQQSYSQFDCVTRETIHSKQRTSSGRTSISALLYIQVQCIYYTHIFVLAGRGTIEVTILLSPRVSEKAHRMGSLEFGERKKRIRLRNGGLNHYCRRSLQTYEYILFLFNAIFMYGYHHIIISWFITHNENNMNCTHVLCIYIIAIINSVYKMYRESSSFLSQYNGENNYFCMRFYYILATIRFLSNGTAP